MANQVDLASLFSTVTQNLAGQKEVLNKADTYNSNHGDNMVDIFKVITQAMEQKKTASPSDQLAYASQILKQKESGSAKVYSQNLSKASEQLKGQSGINIESALSLLQTLLGVGAMASSKKSTGSGGILGSLLSGLLGGGKKTGATGLDTADLLSMGMSFLQSQGQGGGDIDSLVKAFVSNSAMAESPHRAQSGTVVANTLLQMLGSMGQQ